MSASKRVYITTEITRLAEVYHTNPDCRNARWSEHNDIALSTAQRHGVRECMQCSGESSLNDLQQKLYKMDVNDVPELNGGSA